MRIPQELVDAVIDCIGADYTKYFAIGRLFQFVAEDSVRTELKSLALVSRACNHRARSHLFARCKFINSGSGAFERFGQCPDALLSYIRILTIRFCRDQTAILAVLHCFISSPLVSIRFHSTCIPEDLPALLKSLFPDVRRVTVMASTLSLTIILNLIGILEHTSELWLHRCRFVALEADDNPPNLPPLRGRLVLSEPRPPHSAITGLLSRMPIPLRSLRHNPRGLPSENELIGACAGSLENLEVGVVAICGKPFVSMIALPITYRFDP